MAEEIVFNSVGGNYEKDEQKAKEASPIISINYLAEKGEITFAFDIDKDDHYLIYTFDLGKFLSALGEAVKNPED